MKKNTLQVRKHKLIFRVSDEERSRIEQFQQGTTEKTISNYLRKISLQQPVVIRYRNASADDYLRDMLALKRELNTVGNNFNQAVKKLHVLEKIPEFRAWLLIYEKDRITLLDTITTIEALTVKLYEQWLQKSVSPNG